MNPESSSEVKEAREIVEGSFDVKLINIYSKRHIIQNMTPLLSNNLENQIKK